MNNFNSKDVLINDVSLCGDLPTVQTAINELIQQVIAAAKAANPNFNGGIEDVRKAAVAASQQKPAKK